MGSKLTVEQVVANLEARAVFHREQDTYHRDQEAFHAQQVLHHQEQRALHAAELEKVLRDLEAFRAVASSAAAQPLPKPPETELSLPPQRRAGRLVRLAVDSPDLEEPFGPTAVAEETSRRFADYLREPVGPRTASVVLRRMLAEGEIALVRKGTAKREALYKRLPTD